MTETPQPANGTTRPTAGETPTQCRLCRVRHANWLVTIGNKRPFGVCGRCRPAAERTLSAALDGGCPPASWIRLIRPPVAPPSLPTTPRQRREAADPVIGTGERQPVTHEMTGIERDLSILDTEWIHPPGQPEELIALAVRRLRPDGTGYEAAYTVRPRSAVDASTRTIHGYTDKMLADAPGFGRYASRIMRDLKHADIGGYAIRKDIAVLEHAFRGVGIRWPNGNLNIVDGLRIWQCAERRSLDDALARFTGLERHKGEAHDAAADALAAERVITAVAGDLAARTIQAATDPDMVDPAGKFGRDEDGRIIFRFGKHNGRIAIEHADFLEWMTGRDFPPSTLTVVDELLKFERIGEWQSPADEPY